VASEVCSPLEHRGVGVAVVCGLGGKGGCVGGVWVLSARGWIHGTGPLPTPPPPPLASSFCSFILRSPFVYLYLE
jgi:hypothetical protein